MARLCERPGCSAVAETTYGIDAEHLTVWVDVLPPAREARSGVLCLRHADAMIVPLGWMIDDRREVAPRLFRPAAAEVQVAHHQRRRIVRHDDDAEQLSMDDTEEMQRPAPEDLPVDGIADGEPSPMVDPTRDVVPASTETRIEAGDGSTQEPEPAPAARPAHDEASVVPWQPVFDQRDDLAGLLGARSPLLSRAFRGEPIEE